MYEMKNMSSGNKTRTGKKPTVLNTFKRDYHLWIMLSPAIIIILLFNYVPMYGIQLAFRDFDFNKGLTGGDFAGMKYFSQYFSSPQFWPTLRNTFVIAFSVIIVGFPLPILLALIFNQVKNRGAKKTLQTTVYMPYFISNVVLVSMLSLVLSPNTGLISNALKGVGFLPAEANLMGEAKYFVPVYVISEVWRRTGWNSIIYFAALSSVDTQLYDAAKIDGAGRMRIIWNIELPAITPTIVILLILNMGGILSVGFERIFLMQNNLNLPASEVISTFVYKVGIKSNQFSFGSAVGLFNTIVNFVFLMLTNMISKKTSDIGLM